jgi:hypothetical protein
MTQVAKAQEPSMEEILASIRRIIADDDATKPARPAEPLAPKPAPVVAIPVRPAPPPLRAPAPPPPPPPPPAVVNNQDDIDAMLADLDAPPGKVAGRSDPLNAVPPKPDPADVLDLTEAMTAATPLPGPAPSFRTIDGQSDVFFSDRPAVSAPEPAARNTVEEARRQFAQASPERSLLSSTASAAVDSAFNSLAHTVLVQNARTLEDLVREMLRPMLKAWLDDNLPGLVDRIVRAEIERVARGRG